MPTDDDRAKFVGAARYVENGAGAPTCPQERYDGRRHAEEPKMKYMLLMNYAVDDVQPMTTCIQGEIKAHIDFQNEMNKELTTVSLSKRRRSRRPSWPGS